MATPDKPILIVKGAKLEFSFIRKDASAQPIPMPSTYTAKMHIRLEVEDTTFKIELTTENGGISLNENTGEVILLISTAVTTDIDWESAVYDLFIYDDTGEGKKLMKGAITLEEAVTRT